MNKNKPNIVFFFTDDQRFDTINAWGYPFVKTPNMDKLVAMGTSFTRAHIPGGTVPAVCMPSRAMLHTGRTLFNLFDSGQEIPEDHELLGETLQKAGYRTFGTGKWHNGTQAYARSFTDGGEILFGGMGDHWNVPACHFDPTGKYECNNPFIKIPSSSNKLDYRLCDHTTAGKHSSELFCDFAVDFIDEYDDDAPFFMYISFMAPHDPRTMPEEFRKMYDPETTELPPNFMGGHPIDTGALHIRDELLAEFPRGRKEIKQHIAEYYGMITHLDHEMGKVITALGKKGELENTIFVFAGDNGLAVGQHGLMGKQNLYEHSVRVPLIFAGPGVPKGQQRDTYTYLLDIYPSLCDLIGVDIPETVEGKSLVKAMNDPEFRHRETLYLAYGKTIRGVRDDQFKLIEYVVEDDQNTQLFDLKNDPWELNNLASDPEYADKLQSLKEELFRLRDKWNDTSHPIGKVFWENYKRC